LIPEVISRLIKVGFIQELIYFSIRFKFLEIVFF